MSNDDKIGKMAIQLSIVVALLTIVNVGWQLADRYYAKKQKEKSNNA